jgi:hypothetical protein
VQILGLITLAVVLALGVGLGGVGAARSPASVEPGDITFNTVTLLPIEDTAINAWLPTSNYAASWMLNLRSDGVSSLLFKFDLTSIPFPRNAAVAQATLKLYTKTRSNASSMPAYAAAVNRPWVAGQANWTKADSATAWTAPGCSGIPDDWSGTGSTPTEINETEAWFDLDATQMVREWLNGSRANNGLIVKSASFGSSVGYDVVSANNGDQALRPKLQIVYVLLPTATATPTPTNTPTATPTFTPTPTATATPMVPALSLEMTGVAGPLPYGQLGLPYDITLRNIGTGVAHQLVITDQLPLGTMFVSCAPPGIYDADTHVVTWYVNELSYGEQLTFRLNLELESWVKDMGAVVNQAWARAADAGEARAYWQTIIMPVTPTETSTPTVTSTPAATETPTATITPTPTATPIRLFFAQFYRNYLAP